MEHVPVEEKETDDEAEPEQLAKLAIMQDSPIGRRIMMVAGVSALLFVVVNAGSARLPIAVTLVCVSFVAWFLLTKVAGLDLVEVWYDLTGDRKRLLLLEETKEKKKNKEWRYELALAGIPCFVLIALMNNDVYMSTLIGLISLTCFTAFVVSGARCHINTPQKKEKEACDKKDK